MDSRKLDRLSELASQLGSVEGALDRLAESLREHGVDPALAREAQRARSVLRRRTQELREGLLDAKMAALDEVFARVATLLRDLAVERGARVRLITRGGDTRIERTLAGPVGGALLDLVRDAIGRAASVASREGERASARATMAVLEIVARLEGRRVTIEMRFGGDAGAGALRCDDRVLDAARGSLARVGANVVRPGDGAGNAVRIELPVEFVRVPALLFEAGGCLLAMPRDAATAVRAFTDADVRFTDGQEGLCVEAEVVPMQRLRERLGLGRAVAPGDAAPDTSGEAPSHAFLLDGPNGRWALAVDRLLGREELVVSAFGPSLRGAVPGLVGAADLGDDRIALMLDPRALVGEESDAHREGSGATPSEVGSASAVGLPDASAGVSTESALIIECAGQRAALLLSTVREVMATPRITSVPQAPGGVLGVVSRHGVIVTVFDFAWLTGRAAPVPQGPAPIVLVEVDAEVVGLRVERVLRVTRDRIAESPTPVNPAWLLARRGREAG